MTPQQIYKRIVDDRNHLLKSLELVPNNMFILGKISALNKLIREIGEEAK